MPLFIRGKRDDAAYKFFRLADDLKKRLAQKAQAVEVALHKPQQQFHKAIVIGPGGHAGADKSNSKCLCHKQVSVTSEFIT